MNFEAAFAYLMKDEGGFVNHKADSGGATNYGITKGVLSRWRHAECTDEDVKNLTVEEAKEIYKAWYWDLLHLDVVASPAVSCAAFDAAVLFGVSTVGERLQSVLNALGIAAGAADGIVGPKTIAALNAADAKAVITGLRQQLVVHVVQIVQAQPKNVVFQNGWLARVDRYKLLAV